MDASTVAPFQFCSTEAGFTVKVAAHRAATAAIKAWRPELQVGWTLANSDIQAIDGGEELADQVRRPQALKATIREAARTAGVPVIVTENGLATEDDTQRVDYVRAAVDGVASCLADGINVRAYIAWTALDN